MTYCRFSVSALRYVQDDYLNYVDRAWTDVAHEIGLVQGGGEA
jgi:hypothetical protein